MKKIAVLIITLLMFPLLFSAGGQARDGFLDKGGIEYGIIGVSYPKEDGIRYKVAVKKGSETYYYDYVGPGTEFYPLQLGNGEYEISLLRNLSGTKYVLVHKDTVRLNLENENAVYLQSVQNIHYEPGMKAVSKAEELTRGIDDTLEKVKAVHHYIVSNIQYDYDFDFKADKQYIPDIEKTFSTKKGICYDFASLFAAMLRSQGIPAKLVKGYSENVKGYHAWNEVLVDGQWITIDTTYDATVDVCNEAGMIKDRTAYRAERYY